MTNHADPWGLPVTPAMSPKVYHRTTVERIGGPEWIYDADNADPDWKPNPVGFAPPAATQPRPAPALPGIYDADTLRRELGYEADPILWEGDNA